MVIPATNQQTTSSRRKRFVTELKQLLDPRVGAEPTPEAIPYLKGSGKLVDKL